METKVFSLDEATGLIPKLEDAFEVIFFLNSKLKDAAKDIEDLFGIWGESVQHKNNPDHELYNARVAKKQELLKELREKTEEIQETGCQIKDIEKGLIDFPSEVNGQIIFLCWKYGEGKIEHWHGSGEGFTGRKPIKDLPTPSPMK